MTTRLAPVRGMFVASHAGRSLVFDSHKRKLWAGPPQLAGLWERITRGYVELGDAPPAAVDMLQRHGLAAPARGNPEAPVMPAGPGRPAVSSDTGSDQELLEELTRHLDVSVHLTMDRGAPRRPSPGALRVGGSSDFDVWETGAAMLVAHPDWSISVRWGDVIEVQVSCAAGAGAIREPLVKVLNDTVAFCHEAGGVEVSLHAAAVGVDGVTVALTGLSGMGKSTICASAPEAGLGVVADDVVTVSVSAPNELRTYSLHGFTRLAEALSQRSAIRMPDPVGPMFCAAVIHLARTSSGRLVLDPLDEVAAWTSVLTVRASQTRFVPDAVTSPGHEAAVAQRLLGLCQSVPHYRLEVPTDAAPEAARQIHRLVTRSLVAI